MIVQSGKTPRYHPSPAEVERLREQGNQHRVVAGVRMTPTTGQPSAPVRQARQYLGGMVDRLAGNLLKGANKHVVPTIYSSDEVKVFVEPVGPNAFELGVTTGALRKLRHEEELAFLVSHELSRALAGESSTPETSWLRPQVNETIYDHHAIEMMVNARYNPEGALSALQRLYADHPPSSHDLKSWTRGGLLHHHEGVRISLDQAKLEMIHRYQPASRFTTPLTPLPASLRLRTAPRNERREPGSSAYARTVNDMATAFLKNDPAVPSLEGFSPHPYQIASAFDQAFRAVARTDAAPQAKVDATLHLLHRLSLGSTSFKLDDQTVQDLSLFLLRNSVGPNGWKAASFLSGNAEHNASLATHVLMNPDFEPLFGSVYKIDPQWRELIDSTPRLLLHGDASKPESWHGFSQHVRTLAQREQPGPLDAAHKRNVLGLLERAPLANMAAQTTTRGDLQFFREWKPILFAPMTPFDHVFHDAVKQVLTPGVEMFRQFREQAVLGHLQSGSPDAISRSLGDFFSSDVAMPIGPEFEQKLAPPLDAFVHDANTRPDYFYGTGLTPLDNHLELGRFLTRQPSAEALTFVASHHNYVRPLSKSSADSEVLTRVSQQLAQSDPEAFVCGVETRSTQYDKSLGEALAARLGLPSVDIESGALGKLLDDIEAGAVPTQTPPDPQPGLRCSFIAAKERNRQLSPLALVGYDADASQAFAKQMSFPQLQRVMAAVDGAQRRHQTIYDLIEAPGSNLPPSADSCLFLLDALLEKQHDAPSLEAWHNTASQLFDANPTVLDGRPQSRDRLEEYLLPKLQALPPADIEKWLGKKWVPQILKAENLAALVGKLLEPKLGNPAALGTELRRLDNTLQLGRRHPETYGMLCTGLAEKANLQPHQLASVMPSGESSLEDKARQFDHQIEGLSLLVSLARQQSAQDQIDTIEYLMGRQRRMPTYLHDATRQLDGAVPLVEMVRNARSHLQHLDVGARVLVVDSMLAGPNAFIRKPEGMKLLLDSMLAGVSEGNRGFAEKMARALLSAQGSSDSLALAYVLGQRAGSGGDEAADNAGSGVAGASHPDPHKREGEILNNLFDAFGVPGVKLKQYLAFTSDFSQFKETFESAQDAAMPINYFDAIKLVAKRFNGSWPQDLKIKQIKGSGSVNIALEYYNPATRKSEVLQIARDEVENTTEWDFLRLKSLLSALTSTPEDKKQFGYLLGLTDIIHESVKLEFDKPAAFDMQKSVQRLYTREVNGWHVRTVDAFELQNMSIRMEMAKGETARKILTKDPKAYKEAMKAICQVETDVLFGIDQHEKWRPVSLHANPDVHDGQVLIDPESKTVTLLDFGQAVPINNSQRDFAMDLLSIMAGLQFKGGAVQLLNKHAFGGREVLTKDDIAPIMGQKDRMDRFIRLLSLVNQKGGKVPIAVVHWILAVNRAAALGKKAGYKSFNMMRNMVITRRATSLITLGASGGLGLYNMAHLGRRHVMDAVHKCVLGPAAAVAHWVADKFTY